MDPWMAAMRVGDFERAWAINDRDIRCLKDESKHVGPRHLQRIWRGERLEGRRVLVRCYHGLGDTIQFLRFVKPLRAIAADVTLWVQPVLLPLVREVDGVDRALPLHDGAFEREFDVDIEIMELAHALRAEARMVSQSVPYIRPICPTVCVRDPDEPMSVGVVWRAGNWDARRSMRAEDLAPLASIRSVRLHSLQLDAREEELSCLDTRDWSDPDAAALVHKLLQFDLVISVDTFVAHLAGAMGRPVWLLLHHDCDWRWGRHRDDSVWYPTMRLFRQTAAGDWSSVIRDAARHLSRMTGDKSRARPEHSL